MVIRKITCVAECNTNGWQLQSSGYDTPLAAKMAGAKVFTFKPGAMVKPHEGKWAVYFRQEVTHA